MQVVTAYLMASERLSDTDALKKLREQYPIAQPNPNFLEQLGLFWKMGCRIDPYNADYKTFKLRLINHQYKFGRFANQKLELGDVEEEEESLSLRVSFFSSDIGHWKCTVRQ